MKKGIVSVALLCFYGPVAVIACSSSSSSGGSGSVSSIDSTKQASSLSDAEKTQYCKDVIAYNKANTSEADAKKAACFSTAVSSIYLGGTPPKDDAELRSKCKTAYSDCLSKPAATSGDAGTTTTDDCSSATKDLANCTATVGELNTCVADQVAAAKAAYAKFDTACDNLQMDGGGLDKSTYTQPASCKAISTKCPAIAGETADSTTGK